MCMSVFEYTIRDSQGCRGPGMNGRENKKDIPTQPVTDWHDPWQFSGTVMQNDATWPWVSYLLTEPQYSHL